MFLRRYDEVGHNVKLKYFVIYIADKSMNESEKTFAIIVGLLAGVALIIIFVNFIRNVSERDGII